MADIVKLIILASGSKANASVLDTGRELILIDAGLSTNQLKIRMLLAGMKLEDISAVLITHEHADHSVALSTLCASTQCPIYANSLTAKAISNRGGLLVPKPWRIFKTGSGFSVGSLHVDTFSVNHDAADPVGFVISNDGGKALGFATDLGSTNDGMMEKLERASTLFIEANYAEAMLEADTTRPWRVKERIAHVNGHLSNEQAAQVVSYLPDLQKVILGHLSSATNTPDAARECAARECVARGSGSSWSVEVAWRPESERCLPPQVIEIL